MTDPTSETIEEQQPSAEDEQAATGDAQAPEPEAAEETAESETPETADSNGDAPEVEASDEGDEAEAADVPEPVDPEVLAQRIEAVLMSIERPITPAKLAKAVGAQGNKAINEAVRSLNGFYEAHNRTFQIEQVAGGFQILTLPAFKEIIASLHKTKEDNKLSPAALETLAIVAYRQPIMRSAIETIRGVACGEVLRVLMDHHLVKIVGRAEELGRPMLYGTTKKFLEQFGLSSLKDLPKVEELNRS